METLVNILRNSTVLISYKCQLIGVVRKLKPEEEDVALTITATSKKGPHNERLVRGRKTLFNKDHLKDVKHITGQVRNYLHGQLLRFPRLSSVYVCPVQLWPQVREKLAAYKTAFDEAVAVFASNYENILAEARERLGSFFDENDYPAQPVESFSFSHTVFSLESHPSEQDSVAGAVADFRTEATEQLRARFADIVASAIGQLRIEYDNTGNVSKGAIRTDLLDKLNGFVAFMDSLSRSLTSDDTVYEYLQQLKGLLNPENTPVNVERLRSDEDFRTDLFDQFQDLQDAMKSAWKGKVGRYIEFDDAAE